MAPSYGKTTKGRKGRKTPLKNRKSSNSTKKKLTFSHESASPSPPTRTVQAPAKRAPSPSSSANSEPQLYQPPPKRYRRLEPAEEIAGGGDDLRRLEAVYYEEVRDKYTELEADCNSTSQEEKQNRTVRDANLLKQGEWRLFQSGVFSNFLHGKPNRKRESLDKCLKRLQFHLRRHIRENKPDVIRKYQRFVVQMRQYHGFNPLRDPTWDEPAYKIAVQGKTAAGKWEDACVILLGSMGTQKLEACFDCQGDRFAFYPFILTTGEDSVSRCIFDYLKGHYEGPVEQYKFGDADMWRLLTLCLFFVQKLPKRANSKKPKRPKVNLSLMTNQGNVVEWEFDMSNLMDEIKRREEHLATATRQYITSDQVEMTKAAVLAAYRRDDDGVLLLKEFQLVTGHPPAATVSVTSHGELKFNIYQQAVAFLYFFSRYRVRTFLHKTLGVTFQELMLDLEAAQEEPTRESSA
ncbi:hypothetical protein BV898_10013 [Hypsibius exemplaris]|uniref:Uncharacterized protein n=1 Tax=Hypsibius exemplaris TaxID=2072580 RepID=A0A1W0WL78_HYPEX|nr:hypothetical protein BV898_10013 [Hypsibius exemplaris]